MAGMAICSNSMTLACCFTTCDCDATVLHMHVLLCWEEEEYFDAHTLLLAC